MIIKKTQEVYFAPTANKTFITKRAAARAEARAKIKRKYPTDHFEPDTGYCWYWRTELKNADKIYKRLSDILFKAI